MGTRNKFNVCHPCCVDVFPCTHCDDTPPAVLPITFDDFTAIPYSFNRLDCDLLNAVYLLDFMGDCYWEYNDEIPSLGCYGGTARIRVTAYLGTMQSGPTTYTRWVVWHDILCTVSFLGMGATIDNLLRRLYMTDWELSPIDCDETKTVPLYNVRSEPFGFSICNPMWGAVSSCQIN